MTSPDIWVDLLQLIYIAPAILAFMARVFWWIYLSGPEDSFLPDKDAEPVLLLLAIWPLIFVALVAVGVTFLLVWPFYCAAKKTRERRINGVASTQNVSRVTCGQQQQQQ